MTPEATDVGPMPRIIRVGWTLVLLVAFGRPAEARPLEHGPGTSGRSLTTAQQAIDEGHLQRAIEVLERLLAEDPDDGAAREMRQLVEHRYLERGGLRRRHQSRTRSPASSRSTGSVRVSVAGGTRSWSATRAGDPERSSG